MISLYSLGFRESRQSREDVTAAAFADLVLNPLVTALSSTNITWTAWKSISFDNIDSADGDGKVQVLPRKSGEGSGWFAYIKLEGTGTDTPAQEETPAEPAEDMNKVLADGTLGVYETDRFMPPPGVNLNLDCDGSDADASVKAEDESSYFFE